MRTRNAYATSRTEAEFGEPDYAEMDPRYAVPPLERDAPYNDEFGWAPALRLSPASIPDTTRLGTEPLRDYRPTPVRPPEEFWRRNDRNKARRHSIEQIDANGWDETKTGTGHASPERGAFRWAPNPTSTPPPENRVTQRMAPRGYTFWRPFGTNTPKISTRLFNGMHFSMADHRREYDIYGMAPARTARNTYRLEPAPWDTDLVDMPPDTQRVQREMVPTMEVDYQSRSWRL